MVARTRKTHVDGGDAQASGGHNGTLDVSRILAANLASMAAAAASNSAEDDKDQMLDPAISLAGAGQDGDDDDRVHEDHLRLALQQHNEAEERRRQEDLLIGRNRSILDDHQINPQQYGYSHHLMAQQADADLVSSSSMGRPDTRGGESSNRGDDTEMIDSFPGNAGSEIDPKKTCPFCGRTFSHPGSLGRHLDLKRGTRLHPAARVDQIRGNVKRRGDAVEIKLRRANRAKLYNSREDVKRRAKLRRRTKERTDKAHAAARAKFIQQIGFPNLPLHASFPFFVLYFLPSSQWPEGLPGQDSFNQVAQTIDQVESIASVNSLYRSRLEAAYDRWTLLNVQDKQDLWAKELRGILEMTLGSLTAYDIGNRDNWLAEEEEEILRSLDADKEKDEPDSPGSTNSRRSSMDNVLDDADMTAMAFAAAAGDRKSGHLQDSSAAIALDPNIDSSLLG